MAKGDSQAPEDVRNISDMLLDSRDGLVYSHGVLRNLLVDFTLRFLVVNPTDMIKFGSQYFQQLRTSREMMDKRMLELKHGQFVPTVDNSKKLLPRISKVRSKQRRQTNMKESDLEGYLHTWTPTVYPKTDEQRKTCRELIKDVMLFRELVQEDLIQILDAIMYKEVEADERVVVQGDDGDFLYLIESGMYEAYYASDNGVNLVYRYNNRGTFGEMALMYNIPRACSVRALTHGKLWALDRQTFKKIVLNSARRKRVQYMNLLLKIPLLTQLTEYELLVLADALEQKRYKAEECIVRQGESPDGMYFVVDGVVGITAITDQCKEIQLRPLRTGDYFGELALLEKRPRAATVTALSDVTVAFLGMEAFDRLLSSCKQVMETLATDYKNDMDLAFNSSFLDSRCNIANISFSKFSDDQSIDSIDTPGTTREGSVIGE